MEQIPIPQSSWSCPLGVSCSTLPLTARLGALGHLTSHWAAGRSAKHASARPRSRWWEWPSACSHGPSNTLKHTPANATSKINKKYIYIYMYYIYYMCVCVFESVFPCISTVCMSPPFRGYPFCSHPSVAITTQWMTLMFLWPETRLETFVGRSHPEKVISWWIPDTDVKAC